MSSLTDSKLGFIDLTSSLGCNLILNARTLNPNVEYLNFFPAGQHGRPAIYLMSKHYSTQLDNTRRDANNALPDGGEYTCITNTSLRIKKYMICYRLLLGRDLFD
jgi:hypothetical protein